MTGPRTSLAINVAQVDANLGPDLEHLSIPIIETRPRALDSVTHKMGRDSLRLASQEHVESIVSSKLRSPSYSTKLSDILRVK